MHPEEQSQPVGEVSLTPISLTASQEELCRRLDELHATNGLHVKPPSEMFRGAVFASRSELNDNPDWIAQAANSLRGIIYPFGHEGIPNANEALRQYGSVRQFTQEAGQIYGHLTALAHHGVARGYDATYYANFTRPDFQQLLADFERVMLEVLAQALDVHAAIDDIFISEAVTVEVVGAPPTNI